MKKQIAFYILWDIVFFLILYLHSFTESESKNLFYRMEPGAAAYLWLSVGLTALIGVMVFLLVYIGGKFCLTRKLTICEFLIVGIPAFYVAATMSASFSLAQFTGESFLYMPLWYFYSPISMIAGGIIFGYQIAVLMKRIIVLYKSK